VATQENRDPKTSDKPRMRLPAWLAIAVLAVSMSMSCLLSASAFGAESEAVCPAPTGEEPQCFSVLDSTPEEVSPYTSGTGKLGGFSPKDLREAYKLPTTGGIGQTVAIVDAFNDPNAESDLLEYRLYYGLRACTKSNGCFRKVNQKGEEGSYPASSNSWSMEISLDLDMVSAVCQECHILLVEANSNAIEPLGVAVNEAATLKSTEISNSYGLPEQKNSKGFTEYDSYYNHPGIPTTVAAGDFGYDNWEIGGETPSFPAASPNVISVGGTTIEQAEGSRGWTEAVWAGSGAGCSTTQTKPSWQKDAGCSHRTGNDTAAVANPSTPVSVYDSYERIEKWHDVGGTSVSSPLIAAIYALSPGSARSHGAEVLYGGDVSLFDITTGADYSAENALCPATARYLCTAEVGYDGPSGDGAPNGPFNQECAAITASGSSLQSLTQQSVWTMKFELTAWQKEQKELKCKQSVSVTYEPLSSGKALASWGATKGKLEPGETVGKEKIDQFIGTDVGPEGIKSAHLKEIELQEAMAEVPEGTWEGVVDNSTQISLLDQAGKHPSQPTELNHVVTAPVAQSAIAVIVSTPRGCLVKLQSGATGVTISNRLLQEEWHEDKLRYTRLLKGVTFENDLAKNECEQNPEKLDARSLSSGTTAGFKRYLDDLEPAVYGHCTETAVEAESSACWPNSSILEKTGNETGAELAKKVFTTLGRIGYVDLADALNAGFGANGTIVRHEDYDTFIALINNGSQAHEAEGSYESPEASNEGSRCEAAEYARPKTVAPDVDWSRATQSNATSHKSGVYPICTLTFDVLWERYGWPEWKNLKSGVMEKYTQAQYGTTFSYLRYVTTEGQKGEALEALHKNHFEALPSSIKTEVEEGLTMNDVFWSTSGA
jgi:hypothetical protein